MQTSLPRAQHAGRSSHFSNYGVCAARKLAVITRGFAVTWTQRTCVQRSSSQAGLSSRSGRRQQVRRSKRSRRQQVRRSKRRWANKMVQSDAVAQWRRTTVQSPALQARREQVGRAQPFLKPRALQRLAASSSSALLELFCSLVSSSCGAPARSPARSAIERPMGRPSV